MERITPRKARIGLVAGGLGAYWPQFPDLLPQLEASARRLCERFSASGVAHHWALGTGHRAKDLAAVADLLHLDLTLVSL